MLTVYDCIVYKHDLRLVFLAAVICLMASFSAINLLHHVGRSRGSMRVIWLCVAGVATGFGVWATHFIAMLAYSPGMQSGYHIGLTVLSLLEAIALTGTGFWVATERPQVSRLWAGGVVVGFGVAIMHYTGMQALEMPGRVIWDPIKVIVSIVLSAVLSGMALRVGLRNRTYNAIFIGSAFLAFAICSLHFTGMAAAQLVFDPSVEMSPDVIPTYWIAVLVSISCIVVFILTFSGFVLDVRERRQAKREIHRLNNLANAAFEGLLVCEAETITTANVSLSELLGCMPEQLVGRPLSLILPDELTRQWLGDKPTISFETMLHPINGDDPIAVEVISRTVIYSRKTQQVIAIRDLRDRKKAERDIHYLAHHDTLTGLANRNTFNKELENLMRAHGEGERFDGKYLAVLCLDLDRFKEVNDLFGHAAGDDLLRTVALSSQKVLRKDQLMARLGGDEFAIIVPGLSDPLQAERIALDLLETFQDENRRATTSRAMISTSIGIAVFPRDADDSNSLMSCADTALYQSKADGRGTYCFFEAEMGEQMRDRRRLEHELRFAIQKQELSIAYQPLAKTNSREVVGFEALLRWNQEDRGSVPPSLFIPIAEECGLILQIGEWVLQHACQEAASWERPLTIAVNVSAAQLHGPHFVQTCKEILMQTGLEPERLELEITETALIRDPTRALYTLRQLKKLKVRIAMDDFGTGYSSLSNLRAFPFDKIKIDASFIKAVNVNKEAATIVRAVLGLGRGLELPVLAEGVETEEELAFLNAESCHEAQGYLLGRPQPITTFRHITHPT